MMNNKAAKDQRQEVNKAVAFLDPEAPEREQNYAELDGKKDKTKSNPRGLYLTNGVITLTLVLDGPIHPLIGAHGESKIAYQHHLPAQLNYCSNMKSV
ncbi:MAG: hypothetical protein L0Y50_03870 [Beijerinckiaceae bacterium]|nr:hypothetical protein [Beijerinckiaceae bacterium]MCI0735400.1 hypothetical protein [Beijerinckiaceae bacterium]